MTDALFQQALFKTGFDNNVTMLGIKLRFIFTLRRREEYLAICREATTKCLLSIAGHSITEIR